MATGAYILGAYSLWAAPAETGLARRATTSERRGGIARTRGYRSVPPKDGHEVVYKPYGASGPGFYYIRKAGAPC